MKIPYSYALHVWKYVSQILIFFQDINITEPEYTAYIIQKFGQDIGEKALSLYPASSYSSPVQALIDLYR